AFFVDDLQGAPSLARVMAALQEEVDIAVVSSTGFPAFAKSQQRLLLGYHQGKDAVGVMATLTTDENIRLHGWPGSLDRHTSRANDREQSNNSQGQVQAGM